MFGKVCTFSIFQCKRLTFKYSSFITHKVKYLKYFLVLILMFVAHKIAGKYSNILRCLFLKAFNNQN